ncbi:MAG: gfo/Idh/MocA family oxidoreductase [Candidatus Omnitrophota bacterium]|jgi:predicted dehydrogenase|nr:MAG: gfo/Idh/MocA family oxidoreductase [Candidatus Omnitrophota bacterium]
MSTDQQNRREFIRRTTAGAAGIAQGAFGAPAKRVLGANDRLLVAQIGCGGRGMSWVAGQVYRFREQENTEIIAVCDVWKRNLNAAVDRVEKWYGKKPFATSKYKEILSMKEIDAVGIATPDHMHSRILADAARAKKDMYCEKPMASNLNDARDALHSVQDNQVICQIGVQRRSDGRHKAAAELLQSGILGTISEIEAAWHDSGPRWLKPDYESIKEDEVDWEEFRMNLPRRPYNPMHFRCWHLWEDYTVGTPGLLGSHLVDVATWFMGDPMPLRAVALGGVYVWQDGREHADTLDCTIEYPGFIVEYSTRLGNSKSGPEVTFYGTKGTFDTARFTAVGEGGGQDKLTEPVKVVPQKGEDHVQNWLQCIRTRETPNAPVQLGYAHSVMGIMCYKSWKYGNRFCYDAEREEIYPG